MDQAHAGADAGLCLCIAHEVIYTQQGFITLGSRGREDPPPSGGEMNRTPCMITSSRLHLNLEV